MSNVTFLLNSIYPHRNTQCIAHVIEKWKSTFAARSAPSFRFSHRDAIMISYADSFQGPEKTALQYLRDFLSLLEGAISGVHVLPFFPYSSDDGFSIIDYTQVRKEYGSWEDICQLGMNARLMVDLVMNHCSQQHEWFRHFLEREDRWRDYFIAVDPQSDLSTVFRPRPHPLLTVFQSKEGPLHVWTTFSADQVDLNFAEPRVLAEMLDILFFYISKGAHIIRLDAVAFIWKELGTSSIHHKNTHRIVQYMRAVLAQLAPWVCIITETNVPHEENMSYFGEGNEAHMIYQFALPPLLLDACIRQDAEVLSTWAASLPELSGGSSFFNFAASHDGIGLLPSHGLLNDAQRAQLISVVQERGGHISYKTVPGGRIPYEMNVNYLSAIADSSLPSSLRAKTFLCSQAVLLSLAGLPGIYYHSLIGSENWQEGVKAKGQNRSINREKLSFSSLRKELATPSSLRSMVFHGYKTLLLARSEAFAPDSGQLVLRFHRRVFSVLRGLTSRHPVLCLHNLSDKSISLHLQHPMLNEYTQCRDLLAAEASYFTMNAPYRLAPRGVSWLELAP